MTFTANLMQNREGLANKLDMSNQLDVDELFSMHR